MQAFHEVWGSLRGISLRSPGLPPAFPLLTAIGHVVKWVGIESSATRLLGIQICHNSPRAAVTSLSKVRLIPRSFHIDHE